MTTKTIRLDVEESRALHCDEAGCDDPAGKIVRSHTIRDSRSASLADPALEIICAVVRRSLMYRYHSVSPEFIRDAVQEAACRFYEQRELRAEINARTA